MKKKDNKYWSNFLTPYEKKSLSKYSLKISKCDKSKDLLDTNKKAFY